MFFAGDALTSWKVVGGGQKVSHGRDKIPTIDKSPSPSACSTVQVSCAFDLIPSKDLMPSFPSSFVLKTYVIGTNRSQSSAWPRLLVSCFNSRDA
jgi:hypothetical protein